MSFNRWILSHIWRLLAVSACLSLLLTGVDALTGILDRTVLPRTDNYWLHLLEHGLANTPVLLAFLVVVRKIHGNLDAIFRLSPCSPVEPVRDSVPDTIQDLQRLLASVPRITDLLKHQLDETNQVSGEFAVSILTQISSVQHEASHLLATLTDVRSQTASMCDQAQKLIESSGQKLEEMSAYTTSREGKIRDDSEAIKGVVALTNDLLPLTGLIGTLSKQTRLLALNAAIQAANDHTVGRGFVVVADEMRKLALQIDSASSQVDGVMRRISGIIDEKLLDMVSVHRIETERSWLHTLTDSMTQMSLQFQAAVFGLDRLSKDSHEAVQTIFDAILKAQEMAQFQDISRQQIELVQQGLDLCGERMGGAAVFLSGSGADRAPAIAPLDDVLQTLESRYSMHSQQSIHDRVVFDKSNGEGRKEPIVELF